LKFRKLRLKLALRLLRRLSHRPVCDLIDVTQKFSNIPPDLLIRRTAEMSPEATVDLAYKYRIALEHDPVIQDLFGRLYEMHQDLGKAILQGRCDEWGNDLTDGYRKAFGVLENIIAIPGQLDARKEEIEEVGYGIPPKDLDTTGG